MENSKYNRSLLLITAFIEGGAVMATELIGAKMIGPFYGSSLYVWTAVLAVTLTGLGAGYLVGGILSEKKDPELRLFSILATGATLVGFMPFIATLVMKSTMHLDLRTGITVSCIVFLFPPLFCFGMISPLAVRVLTQGEEQSGKIAGTVYAISTAGGILFTFIAGFYTIPELGLKMSAYLTATLTALMPVFFFVSRKRVGKTAFLVCMLLLCSVLNAGVLVNKPRSQNSYIKVIYKEDGVMGQIIVADDLKAKSRSLLVNNISQTFINEDGKSKWGYIKRLSDEIGSDHKQVLIAGMGGGILARELSQKNISYHVIDLDERMKIVSSFFSGEGKDLIVDDIRHYINTTTKKYDAIVLDISQSENQPAYVYTIESFKRLSEILNEKGKLLVHFPAVYHKEKPSAAASLEQTMRESGFTTTLLQTKLKEDETCEMIFCGTKDPETARRSGKLIEPGFSKGLVFTDDQPLLEKLHLETLHRFRKEGINEITATLLKEGYTVF